MNKDTPTKYKFHAHMNESQIIMGAACKTRQEMPLHKSLLFEKDCLKKIVETEKDAGIELLKVIKRLIPSEIQVDEIICKLPKYRV